MPFHIVPRRRVYRLLAALSGLVVLCVGFALVYCYFNYQFWTHFDTRGFQNVAEYRSERIRGFRGKQIFVHKDFLGTLHTLEAYAQKEGVRLIVTSSLRREKSRPPGAIVQPADSSNHLAGHAIDINIRHGSKVYRSPDLGPERFPILPPPVRDFVQRVREDPSLRWGGDFYSEPDPVHIDDELNRRDCKEWKRHKDASQADLKDARHKWRLW